MTPEKINELVGQVLKSLDMVPSYSKLSADEKRLILETTALMIQQSINLGIQIETMRMCFQNIKDNKRPI